MASMIKSETAKRSQIVRKMQSTIKICVIKCLYTYSLHRIRNQQIS